MEMIERNVKVQLRLIEDLLDMNRTAKGKMSLVMAEADVSAILRSAVENILGDAEKKRITIDFAGAGKPLQMQADSGRLQQSPPPLHQPGAILQHRILAVQCFSANGDL